MLKEEEIARTRAWRARAQKKWRKTGGKQKVEVYLDPKLVEKLDRLVAATEAPGRGAVLAELIGAAKVPRKEKQNESLSG